MVCGGWGLLIAAVAGRASRTLWPALMARRFFGYGQRLWYKMVVCAGCVVLFDAPFGQLVVVLSWPVTVKYALLVSIQVWREAEMRT